MPASTARARTAAAVTGALFLQPAPASAAVTPSPLGSAKPTPLRPAPTHVHLPGGMREKFRLDRDLADEIALEDRLVVTLTAEQRRIFFDHDARRGASVTREQDRFVEELARHFPQLAPAIRCVAYHVTEERLGDEGTCCAHPWEDVPTSALSRHAARRRPPGRYPRGRHFLLGRR